MKPDDSPAAVQPGGPGAQGRGCRSRRRITCPRSARSHQQRDSSTWPVKKMGGRGRGWRVPDIRAQSARLTLHSVRGATCFYGRDTGAKVTICPTRHRQEMQDRIHGVQTESARPLPAAPLSRTPCFLAFVTRRPPVTLLPEPSERAHATTAEASQPPWRWQRLAVMRARPVRVAAAPTSCQRSFQQPPPSCVPALLALWGRFPSLEGKVKHRRPRLRVQPCRAVCSQHVLPYVGSLAKTGDKQSPRGPARGGDGQDLSALLCPALPCRAGPCHRRGPEGPSGALLFPGITETGSYM